MEAVPKWDATGPLASTTRRRANFRNLEALEARKESIIFYNWPSMDHYDHYGTFIAWLYTMAKEVIS